MLGSFMLINLGCLARSLGRVLIPYASIGT